MEDMNISREKLDNLVSLVIATRSAHTIQKASIETLIKAVDELDPHAIARVEATDREQILEELHR